MKMKPILFNTEMVRANLDGRKTATRRIVKPQPSDKNDIIYRHNNGHWYISPDDDNIPEEEIKPPYQKGDILYVRETWAYGRIRGGMYQYFYKADYDGKYPIVWHPSIHMPKEAARIFLRVTDVRVEQLQDMRLKDCLAEGIMLTSAEIDDCIKAPIRARERFATVWNGTVKPADLPLYGFDANPWVWVISFERISKEETTR